jgi:hypothetical protein
MYAVIRRYTAAAAIFEELQQQQGEVQELLRAVPGFVTYYAIRAADGVGATITVAKTRRAPPNPFALQPTGCGEGCPMRSELLRR